MADVIMKKRFERIELSLPGKKILDGRRLLKIEVVDSNGRLLEFHELVTPKLELDLVRLQKRSLILSTIC